MLLPLLPSLPTRPGALTTAVGSAPRTQPPPPFPCARTQPRTLRPLAAWPDFSRKSPGWVRRRVIRPPLVASTRTQTPTRTLLSRFQSRQKLPRFSLTTGRLSAMHFQGFFEDFLSIFYRFIYAEFRGFLKIFKIRSSGSELSLPAGRILRSSCCSHYQSVPFSLPVAVLTTSRCSHYQPGTRSERADRNNWRPLRGDSDVNRPQNRISRFHLCW